MTKYFLTDEGKHVNLIDHIIEEVKENPYTKIYISTDSQNYGARTVFATAIVFRYGLRGAHYVYRKDRVPRIRDTFSRLWKEAEYTIEIAEYITSLVPVKIEALEFDYNNKKVTKSTNLVTSVTGWAKSLGYNALVKPDEMIAAKAADHVCRL